MNISGVVVYARPEQTSLVQKGLLELEGVEVHGLNPDGRIVVTVEQDDEQKLADRVLGLNDMPGVLSAAMIYHHSEVLEDECEPKGGNNL